MGVIDQLHVPAALSQGKSPPYTLHRRLSGYQSRSGRGVEEEDVGPAGNRTPVVQPIVLVTVLTELPRLIFMSLKDHVS